MNARRGFTAVEAVAVLLLVAVIVAIMLPGMSRTRCRGSRLIKDSTQIRNVLIAIETFAQSNKGLYPLPSLLDKNHATLKTDEGEAFRKETTGNLFSILIFNGNISPEIMVSPAEASSGVRLDDDYQGVNPPAAADPGRALWDPGFAGTPEQVADVGSAAPRVAGVGNASYAHVPLHGPRLSTWKTTFSSTTPLVGNRGPGWTMDPASSKRWRLNASGASPPGEDSVTLLIHGGRDSWEGNIGYADNRVNFETRPDPIEITYKALGPDGVIRDIPDNVFENEADEAGREPGQTGGLNAWLTMISGVKAGGELRVFKD